MIKIYGIKNCDTIKKTIKWFTGRQLEFELYDYKKRGVSAELAELLIDKFGIENLINRRGTTWRKLPENSRLDHDRESVISLLCSHPSVIKRPIVNWDNSWIIGLDETQLQTLLQN